LTWGASVVAGAWCEFASEVDGFGAKQADGAAVCAVTVAHGLNGGGLVDVDCSESSDGDVRAAGGFDTVDDDLALDADFAPDAKLDRAFETQGLFGFDDQ